MTIYESVDVEEVPADATVDGRYAAEYQRRVARAREAGYTGYAQQRAVEMWVAQHITVTNVAQRARIEAGALRALRRAAVEGRRGTTSDILDDWQQNVRDQKARLQAGRPVEHWRYVNW